MAAYTRNPSRRLRREGCEFKPSLDTEQFRKTLSQNLQMTKGLGGSECEAMFSPRYTLLCRKTEAPTGRLSFTPLLLGVSVSVCAKLGQ